MVKPVKLARMFFPLVAAAMVVSAPVAAQMSPGFKFLEAVRKKDGQAVTDALEKPGPTLVNTRDVTTGETALHIVTARRDVTWMSFLVGKGADVNARDAKGVTPMVLASNMGFSEGVEFLVSRGARVDEPTNAGETPLIAAVHRHDLGLMRVLLLAGADPDRSDNSGRSARDYAKLDGENSPMLTEIKTNAKPKAQRGAAQKTYGPTF